MQGTFGKVYTAINNETGDIMAMKELPLQPNDHKTLRNVAEELRIFESIRHKHLINHYGVEVGRLRTSSKLYIKVWVSLPGSYLVALHLARHSHENNMDLK